jgi:CRP-like cAMP-binding protein
MKEIRNEALLKRYLEKYAIEDLFETKDLPFRLVHFDKGEIINYIQDASSALLFLADGAIQLYSLYENGGRYPLSYVEEFTLLGDMEFCNQTSLPFLVEASKNCTFVQLPLYDCKEQLYNDNRFLRFLLTSISDKLALYSKSEATYPSLEEKLISQMRQCEGQSFQGVNIMAFHLHCSRRQLQRVLKSCTQKGLIEKSGKGSYKLL